MEFQVLTLLRSVIDEVKFGILDQSVDVRKRIVTQRFQGIFDLKGYGEGSPEKVHTIEYVWTFKMDQTGNKVVRVEEDLDPQRLAGHILAKAQRYAAFISNS